MVSLQIKSAEKQKVFTLLAAMLGNARPSKGSPKRTFPILAPLKNLGRNDKYSQPQRPLKLPLRGAELRHYGQAGLLGLGDLSVR